jgi:hypothetical protein
VSTIVTVVVLVGCDVAIEVAVDVRYELLSTTGMLGVVKVPLVTVGKLIVGDVNVLPTSVCVDTRSTTAEPPIVVPEASSLNC